MGGEKKLLNKLRSINSLILFVKGKSPVGEAPDLELWGNVKCPFLTITPGPL